MSPMDCPVCPTRNIPPGQTICPGCGADLTLLWQIRELGSGLSRGPRGNRARGHPMALAAVVLLLVAIPFSVGVYMGRGRLPEPPATVETEHAATPQPAVVREARTIPAEPTDLEPVLAAFAEIPLVTATRSRAGVRVVFREGLFDSGSDAPVAAGRRVLESVAVVLNRLAHPPGGTAAEMTVRVVGHCDSVSPKPGGAWEDNWSLAFQRAHSAVALLRSHAGAETITWTASARGESNAPFSNGTKEGRSRNRTVVLYVAPSTVPR